MALIPPAAAPRGIGEGGRPAVLLDKDGTLLEDVPYNVEPRLMRLAPGAGEALQCLARLGMPLVVVSNQPGVALGRFQEARLRAVGRRLEELFDRHGARLTDFLYCPHHPQGTVARYACACLCRKPRPGLLRIAAARHGLSLARSWMIGDILDDIEAGRRAGCRTILVDRGGETEWVLGGRRDPDHLVERLDAAAEIVRRESAGRPFAETRP